MSLGKFSVEKSSTGFFRNLRKSWKLTKFQATELLTRHIKSSLVGLVGIAMVSLLSTRLTRNSISRCEKVWGSNIWNFSHASALLRRQRLVMVISVISLFHQGHHDVMKLGIAKYNEECRGIVWPSGLRVNLCSDSWWKQKFFSRKPLEDEIVDVLLMSRLDDHSHYITGMEVKYLLVRKNKSLSSVDPWAVECLQVCVRFNDSLQNGGVLLNDLGT